MITANLSFINTDLSWDDLVLDTAMLKKVMELKNWLKQASFLNPADGENDKLKTGYRVLFIGPLAQEKH